MTGVTAFSGMITASPGSMQMKLQRQDGSSRQHGDR